MAEEDIAVTTFREYLRIKTVIPEPDYDSAVAFLNKLGEYVGLEVCTIEVGPGLPVVILSHIGSKSELPSILLYSHMDVVPVFPEHWTYEPFSGHKDDKGDIYGRGAQDMKSVGIQYVEALRRLKNANKADFLRTIHIVFSPEEEITSAGIQGLIKHEKFRKMNVGFSMDEGIASTDDIYRLFYGERGECWIKVTCPGSPGHASRFLPNTAAEKLQKVINKFLSVRQENLELLEKNPDLKLGDVTTINFTKVEGGAPGQALNVAPDHFIAYFDMRFPPNLDSEGLKAQIKQWTDECGSDITVEYPIFHHVDVVTSTGEDNPFWGALTSAFDESDLKWEKAMFFAGTDSRYLRNAGYWSIGFSPMINTPQLLHDHNECLNEKTFLDGLELYCKIIPKLANVPVF